MNSFLFRDNFYLCSQSATVQIGMPFNTVKRYTQFHGLKNNTRLTRSVIGRRKRACDDVTASQILVVLRCCVWLLVEMNSSCAVFGLTNRKSGVNRHLRFTLFQTYSKKLGNVPCVCVRVRILTRKCAVWVPWLIKWITRTHTRTFPSFLEMDKTAGAYSRFTII